MATPKLKIDAKLFESTPGRELLAAFGGDGIAFYLYLLCAIRANGYYIQIDSGFTQQAASVLQITADRMRGAFALLMQHGTFNRELYRMLKILTSEEIQREYFQRTKKAGTPPVWLISCGTPRQELTLPESFSPDLYETVQKWLKYKREKRQGYTETGLRALVREIESHRLAYGDERICKLIDYSMSGNHQGIYWDRLERGAFPIKVVMQNKSAVTSGSSIDKNELRDLIDQRFFGKETG